MIIHPGLARSCLDIKIILLPILLVCGNVFASSMPDVAQRNTLKTFNEVVEDLEFAITENNFRITNHLQIGKAIRERGDEDFPDYSVMVFCNLKIAKTMLEQDPTYINHCPMRISVRQAQNEVIISAPLLPVSGYNEQLDSVIKNLNAALIKIVNYAAEDWLEVNQ